MTKVVQNLRSLWSTWACLLARSAWNGARWGRLALMLHNTLQITSSLTHDTEERETPAIPL